MGRDKNKIINAASLALVVIILNIMCWTMPKSPESEKNVTIELGGCQVEAMPKSLEEEAQEVSEITYIGEFEVTAYCPCKVCCGKNAQGITSTGERPQQGRTVAVDPKLIPYGTQLVIDGQAYMAEDCGSAIKGNKLDIFFNSHSDALAFGRQTMAVYKID